MPLLPDQTLQDYQLIEKIGAGGDGEVWKAKKTNGDLVALKAKPNIGDPSRFQQEFERLRVLRFPNVVRVHSTGISEEYIFYTMELAVGQHFHDYIQEGGNLKDKMIRCIDATEGIAKALSALHRAGIAHLDLKPDNIIVDKNGQSVLLDFGRACAMGDRRLNEGMQSTMQYMAPEQRLGLPTGKEADIYSLGVSIYESLTGTPAPRHLIGQPWPSLLECGVEVSLPFANLVAEMLLLDSMKRPKAEDLQRTLLSIKNNLPLPPSKFPEPAVYIGDASVLLRRSAVVFGPHGSGCTRMLNEARREWFSSGYRSIGGDCHPTKPFGAFVEILSALFNPYSPERRRTIAGDQAATLRVIAPNLPLPSSQYKQWPIPLEELTIAIAQVLDRVKPIALVFYEAHRADPGTKKMISMLTDNTPKGVYIWCSTREQLPWGQHVSPPVWGSYQDEAILKDLLPNTPIPEGPAGKTPLESCYRAWVEISKSRNEAVPDIARAQKMANFSLLESPFPKTVAAHLNIKIQDHIESEAIEVVHSTEDDDFLQFKLYPDFLLARSYVSTLRLNLLAAQAWQRSLHSKLKNQHASYHRLIIGQDCRRNLIENIKLNLDLEDAQEVHRWLVLHDLTYGVSNDFVMTYARAFISLHIRPGRISTTEFSNLSRKASSPRDNRMVDYLGIQQVSKHGSSAHAIESGLELLERLKDDEPILAGNIYQQLAQVYIREHKLDECISLIREGIQFLNDCSDIIGPETANPLRIQLSAALIFNTNLIEAESVCLDCQTTALIYGHISNALSASINLALCYYQQGKRQLSRKIVMDTRKYLFQRDVPTHHAYLALIDGMLAVDRGDASLGVAKLDLAISVAQSIQNTYILANAYSSLLLSSIQTASRDDARRAMHGYAQLGTEMSNDLWPIALAQWKWFNGDLQGARQALKATRSSYEGIRVLLEQSKFELIAGEWENATNLSEKCLKQAEQNGCHDISIVARLIHATSTGKNNKHVEKILKDVEDSEWIELYLGGVYINTIRLKLRGEDITPSLKRLRERANAIEHSLYSALGQVDSW